MNCYRLKIVGEDHSELVIADSFGEAVEKYKEKTNNHERTIIEITDLGEIIK